MARHRGPVQAGGLALALAVGVARVDLGVPRATDVLVGWAAAQGSPQ